eukprot:gene8849-10889_t
MLDEGTDVWRPVSAERLGETTYRLAVNPAAEDETWIFQPGDNDLTRVSADAAATAQGDAFVLRGVVMKEGRIPVPNAILEIWQADCNGRFRHPNDPESEAADPDFLGWGRAWTTVQGEYAFRSVQPGSYVENGRRRAPHINILVMAAGLMRPVATTLYFPAFAQANAEDPVLTV